MRWAVSDKEVAAPAKKGSLPMPMATPTATPKTSQSLPCIMAHHVPPTEVRANRGATSSVGFSPTSTIERAPGP